ncbi:hypothetical protein CPB83DRAFT_857885 [Crepidotus variabilis]|uniref:J domain-containing protein n=1 Tax=Crepidotus variabilis TaxID=179855 RepID=A0A9P6ECV8_9AGAR|nr:hypothetical protein CPB83DRAFT_857885 [Crepidotus variabilis]
MSFIRTLNFSVQLTNKRTHTRSLNGLLRPARWNSNTSFKPPTRSCRSCFKPLPSTLPACPSCWSIYAVPSNISHYQLLEIPEKPNPFSIDLSTLKQRFRKAQVACHPDAWASKDQKYLSVAQTLSSQVNAAYHALSDPLHRATYLLELNGHPIEEADKMEDIEFIGDVMHDIDTIQEAGKEEEAEVREVTDRNDNFIQQVLKDIEERIAQNDWETVKDLVFKLRMARRVQDFSKDWAEKYDRR